jgi:hypothetical protein
VPKVIVEIRVYELPVLLALLDEFERLLVWRLGAEVGERWVEELWWLLREECADGCETWVEARGLYGTRAIAG